MKKRLAALLCAALILLFAALPAAAETPGAPPAADGLETETAEGLPVEETLPAAEPIPETKGAAGGLSAFFVSLFGDHLAEVFGALALAGSCLVAILYKTGLLPLLTRSLGKIGDAANRTADCAGALETQLGAYAEKTAAQLAPFCEIAASLAEEMKRYAAHLDELKAQLDAADDEREQIRLILAGETELLYGILQSASLPQYEKDEIAARYAETRRRLAAEGGDGT